MRRQKLSFLRMTLLCLSWCVLAIATAHADATVTLDQPVHFTTAKGSDVVLEAGSYAVEAAEEWLRVTPGEGQAVDALLLDAQAATHEESPGPFRSRRSTRHPSPCLAAAWWETIGSHRELQRHPIPWKLSF